MRCEPTNGQGPPADRWAGLGHLLRTGEQREGSQGLQDHTCPLDGRGALQPGRPPSSLGKGEWSGLGWGGMGWGGGEAGLPPSPGRTDGVGSCEVPSLGVEAAGGAGLASASVCLSVRLFLPIAPSPDPGPDHLGSSLRSSAPGPIDQISQLLLKSAWCPRAHLSPFHRLRAPVPALRPCP